MRKNTDFSLNIGLPSILLIFVVLCLVSFGILSLVSAHSDKKLSQKVLNRSSSYYETCNQAEEVLAEIYQQLQNAYVSCPTEDAYWDMIKNIPEHYSFPLSDLQNLQITLTFLYPTSIEERFFHVESWKIVASDNIEYDEQLHVIP